MWLTAFLDAPADVHDAQVAFWLAVTGSGLSARRGSGAEFATLAPADGDAHLRVQRLTSGPARVHLDVHVPDVAAAAERAAGLGAVRIGGPDDVAVMGSPGGWVFCFVGGSESRRTPPVAWGRHRSLVDQVCLDIPAASYDVECGFWAALLDLPVRTSSARAEFRHLVRPADQPIRLLLQRLDEPGGPMRAHLDLATDDRDAEVERHLALGAAEVRRTAWWTTLRDPAGLVYCVTIRDPETGLTP